MYVPCIATLPYLGKSDRLISASLLDSADFTASRRISVLQDYLLQQVVDHPLSHFCEGLRSIKVAADLVAANRPNKIIGVTSTFPTEGKTAIASSLALLIAKSGSRVLLVDADLRNSSITRLLVPQATAGLVEVIMGKASLEDVVWTHEESGLQIIPALANARLAHSSDLLASTAAKQAFDTMRKSFDYVIVDLPPLVPIVDVRVTTQLINSFVYVVEWGRTKIEAVEQALGAAPVIHENVLGAVLNKVDTTAQNRYEGYHGSYYFKRYSTKAADHAN